MLLLRQHLLKFIRRSCSFKSSYGPHIDRTYSDFFNSIGNSFQGASLNPEGQVRYDDSWTIFTTNYDRCLEYFWRDCHKVDPFTGFYQKKFCPDIFLFHKKGGDLNRNSLFNCMRIVKLHGSITWLRRKQSKEVEETDYNLNVAKGPLGKGSIFDDEVMIYPVLEKHLFVEPYIQMFYCLKSN